MPGAASDHCAFDPGNFGANLPPKFPKDRFHMTSPIWHPFTQHALTPDATLVMRGEGAWLETDKGKLLDAISSWWVITHGHRHPRIVEAIKQQADALDQVIFAGFTHQPAEDLGRALL